MKSYVKPSFTFIKLRTEEGIACSGSDDSHGGGFDYKPHVGWGNSHGGFFWGGLGNWFGGFLGRGNRR
ncbi:hypothetical protein [Ruminiclostridium cellobioparum]|uniref:hypothetical protein n=1 Tax=Ruminiclostridium cellobioparum TaxID=29355 RepID=UPI00048721C2|nr:hypothetical protein [Ruminiclostridium cellobioparum]